MRARRFSDIQGLLATAEFRGWFDDLVKARIALADAEAAHDELLAQLTLMEFRAELAQKNAIDTLYRGGEHEDSAARMLAEAEELENKSFPGVAAFEDQRFRVSELWYRLGAAEKELEDARNAKKGADVIGPLEKKQRDAADEYERETARKNRLWDEVERLWARSAEVSLLTAEQKVQARKVRKQAEGLFALAEDRKGKSKQLKADTEASAQAVEAARAKLEAVRQRATEQFGCTLGQDFLYFRHRDDNHQAFAVALVEDHDTYNVEVKPLSAYFVDRKTGVTHLEPALAERPSLAEGDRRFETYFLTGRKGRPQAQPSP